MGTTHQSRQVVREKLEELLRDALVPAIVQEVYAYQKEKLKGVSPIIVINSAGTNPLETNNPLDVMDFDLHILVLYKRVGSGSQSSPEYSEQDSENDIDLISKKTFEVMEDNADKTNDLDFPWDEMTAGPSNIDSFTDIEGFEYRHETIPLKVSVYAQG